MERREDEKFLDYAKRLIDNKDLYDLDKSEIYELLYNERVSSDHARKALRVLELTIEESEKCNIGSIHKELNDKDFEEQFKQKSKIELNKDGSQTSDKLLLMSEEDCKNVDYLLEAHGYDITTWQLVSARNNIWNVYSKKDGVKTLYSSKIVVKPIIQEFNIEWAKEVFKELKPLPAVKKINRGNKNKKIVELQYADIHIGLRGCEYEDELNQMTDNIISKFKDADTFVLPIGQDLLNSNHVDGANFSTVHGTSVQQSLDYREMFKSGLRVVCHIIDRIIELNPTANIECIYISGNHDEQSAFGVFQSVMQRYLLNENITFDDTMDTRKYRLYGINAIGFAHGQKEGKRIFGLFPVEAPEIFAKAKCREFHLSHLHNESVKDENGVMFRRMPTVNSPDNWHNNKGFVGATKRIQAFVYDTEIGLEEIKYFYL